MGAAAQSLAPRPPVAAPAPRAVPPYKYASSVRSPHPAVQPLQVPRRGWAGDSPLAAVQRDLCAAQAFLQKLEATFVTQTTIVIWNLKTWRLYLCQGQLLHLPCTCKPFSTQICCRGIFLGSLLSHFAAICCLTSLPHPHSGIIESTVCFSHNPLCCKKKAWMLPFLSCNV